MLKTVEFFSFESILYIYQSGGVVKRPESVPIDTFLKELKFFEVSFTHSRMFAVSANAAHISCCSRNKKSTLEKWPTFPMLTCMFNFHRWVRNCWKDSGSVKDTRSRRKSRCLRTLCSVSYGSWWSIQTRPFSLVSLHFSPFLLSPRNRYKIIW